MESSIEETAMNDVTMETLYPRQQRYTFIGLPLMAYKPYIWNICPLGQHQYLVVLAVMETLLPWQLRNTFIILAFEGVWTSCLADILAF